MPVVQICEFDLFVSELYIYIYIYICIYSICKIALVHIFLKPIFLYIISSRSDRKANEKPKCHWSDVQNI